MSERSKLIRLVIAGASTTVMLAASQAQPISFRNLNQDERVVVTLSSTGCFNYSSRSELSFRSTAQGAVVLEITASSITGADTRRTRELSEAETAKLDALLEYYRHLPEGHICTHVDAVEVRLYRGRKRIAREKYLDSTCQVTNEDLTFSRLVTDGSSEVISSEHKP